MKNGEYECQRLSKQTIGEVDVIFQYNKKKEKSPCGHSRSDLQQALVND